MNSPGDPLAAAKAAYRLGLIDALLHEDVLEKMGMPGIFIESMKGERSHRLGELASEGVTANDLDDWRL